MLGLTASPWLTIIYFGDIDELLVPEIKMIGYEFDYPSIQKRIVKMTDNPDKVYSTAPLKKNSMFKH